MTTHSHHPDILEHGLADGCPRCEEASEKPFENLDDACLRILANIAVYGEGHARSQAERRAVWHVETVIRRAQKLRAFGIPL